ncbi:MAG: hypothetical protein AB7V56_15300 [Candidatus Nitrosocosmicus sp.]
MKESVLSITITFVISVLIISISSQTTFASTLSGNETPGDSQNTASKDSAIEKLAKALQEDKDDGDDNGGKNWEKAIDSLGKEMGFPVDEDVEDALRNITELHLGNVINE